MSLLAMSTTAPKTDWPTFGFQNRELIYDNVDFLQDDYLKLLDHMRITGETTVPLWVFRSLYESFARFMRRVSKGSEEEDCSVQDTDLEKSLAEEEGEIQENNDHAMDGEVAAVDEVKETEIQDSGKQKHPDPDSANTHDNTDNEYLKHSRTCTVDVYEVMMGSVKIETMDLSNRLAMLGVAQDLINYNKLAQPSSHTTNHIVYLRWHKNKVENKVAANVCIGFTSLELASNAIRNGIQWAGLSHSCTPFATGHKLSYCSQCLGYGHAKRLCKLKQRCTKCGLEHSRQYCRTAGKTCGSCGGAHNPGSPKCPLLIKEMMKAGFWPLKASIVNGSTPVEDKGSRELQDKTMFQLQPQSDLQQRPPSQSAPTDLSQGTETLPDPSDPTKIIEHLDRLRALVLANGPIPPIAKEPKRNKRKAQLPVRGVSGDPFGAIPKRLKREEAEIKQEEAIAQWERLYT